MYIYLIYMEYIYKQSPNNAVHFLVFFFLSLNRWYTYVLFCNEVLYSNAISHIQQQSAPMLKSVAGNTDREINLRILRISIAIVQMKNKQNYEN